MLAEFPKAFAVGLPKPALVLVLTLRVLVVAAPFEILVVTPMPAAVGAVPGLGSATEPAYAPDATSDKQAIRKI